MLMDSTGPAVIEREWTAEVRSRYMAFKELVPIPQFKATARLGSYQERVSGA